MPKRWEETPVKGRPGNLIYRLCLTPEYEQHRHLFESGVWSPEHLSRGARLFFPLAAKSEFVFSTRVTDRLHNPTKEKFLAVKSHLGAETLTKEFENLERAHAEGISVKPAGYLAEVPKDNKFSWYSRGWLYTEILPHSISLDTLNYRGMPAGEKKTLLRSLGEAVASWHFKHDFYHGDLNARNILFPVRPGKIRFQAVDLEHSRFGNVTPAARRRDLDTLARSLREKGATKEDVSALRQGYASYVVKRRIESAAKKTA